MDLDDKCPISEWLLADKNQPTQPWSLDLGVPIGVVIALLARGRSRSALTVGSAWIGARAVGSVTGSSEAGWVGLAYGLGRVATMWRDPLTVVWAVLYWIRRRDRYPALARAALSALAAQAAVRLAEVLAPRFDAPCEPRIEVAVVVNTDSGSARSSRRALRALRREAVRILSIEHVGGHDLPSALGRAADLVAAGSGRTRLVAAGGDGTIGQAAVLVADRGVPLAILPTGTGNDIARSLGISLYPEEAAALAARGIPKAIDVVETNIGPFVHAASIGMTARFATLTRDIKGWRRPFIYPFRAIQAWMARERIPAEVTIDGRKVTYPDQPFELAVVNVPRVGGRVGITVPGARADDGRIDIIGVYRNAARRAIQGLIHYIRSGTQSYPTRAIVHRGQTAEIRLEQPHEVSLDGELAGSTYILQAFTHHRSCSIISPKRKR